MKRVGTKKPKRSNCIVDMNLVAPIYNAIVHAPFGAVGVRLNQASTQVQELVYLPSHTQALAPDCDLAERVCVQIEAYVANPSFRFDLPLRPQGTAFQKKVWQVIAGLEAGQVLTYKQVGQLIACGSPRAVGGACGANPFPLIVPCHRVVGAHGIGGFAQHDNGFYIGVKRWLLAHEGIVYD